MVSVHGWRVRRRARRSERRAGIYPRWYWSAFSLPGVLWLILLVVVPFYTTWAVAVGTVDPIFQNPLPAWNPAHWNFGYLNQVVDELRPGDVFWTVAIRTLEYVAIAVAGCIAIGYPVAYYIARRAGRAKPWLLIGLIIPFFISYLMRMLAWIGLLMPDGYVNKVLTFVGLEGHERNWLAGQSSTVIIALIYGYVPYFIIPLYAALDRIDERLLEAARDLGATRRQAFLRVTLPLSKQGMLAGGVLVALPMFGDFYTNDLISGSPQTSMIGNQINLYYQGGVQPTVGAALVILLSVFLAVLMCYYVYTVARASREVAYV
jgi:ABC-type spermidine/putrescine transport system permease subunit I